MAEQEDGFLSRWSRRKVQVRQGGAAAEDAPTAVSPGSSPPGAVGAIAPATPLVPTPAQADATQRVADSGSAAADATAPAPPPPTLEEAQALTPESDFSRFVARDVDPRVKNLAMKKLFADPQFNVMDGLDIYIDDYHTPDPLPKAMLRQLVQARMLGLLDDELEDQIPATQQAGARAADEVPAETPADVSEVVPKDGAGDSKEEPDTAAPLQAAPAASAASSATSAAEPRAGGGRAWESNPPGTD